MTKTRKPTGSAIIAMLLSVFLVFTMMPLAGAQTAHAASKGTGGADSTAKVIGGEVASNSAENALAAFTSGGTAHAAAAYDSGSRTLTITLRDDVTLKNPVRFVKGEAGGKVVLDLSGHSITGKAGETSEEEAAARGGNAIEIAADEFDVEIKGPGAVTGGKGAQCLGRDYCFGEEGGCAVFFCERVDRLYGKDPTWGDIIDEGYHPDLLNHGVTVTGGAVLTGGAGADATYEDWLCNVGGERGKVTFSIKAGKGGAGIGQIKTGTGTEEVLKELSYAKVTVTNGTVSGGTGGNTVTGDHLFTTYDVQRLPQIVQFMEGKSRNYNFESNVTDNIAFWPGDGGNGIEFFAGRKYIDVESGGLVCGGNGGVTECSERAAMVKAFESGNGSGGKGIYVCGDTGLGADEVALSDDSENANYWNNKTKDSRDVGIYIAGTVKGGASPATTILGDSTEYGGTGVFCDLEGRNLCKPYQITYGHRPTFDEDRGIVLIDNAGKVYGGDAALPGQTTINGGTGGEGLRGGATGGPTGGERITASDFVIKGLVSGGYGASLGGDGVLMSKEREAVVDGNSAYYVGKILGDGTIQGGDTGDWPYINTAGQRLDEEGNIYNGHYDGPAIQGKSITNQYGNHTEDGALTISSTLKEKNGRQAKVMKTAGTFSVTPTMTSFPEGTAPTADTKLSCKVTTPDGYKGRVYIHWSCEMDTDSAGTLRKIEAANGAYNNFNLLGNKDYPYGWETASYGYNFHMNIATYDAIANRIKYNDNNIVRIYCKAILEDGRYAENDDIWFTQLRRSSKGWSNGSSSGGSQQDQAAIDQQAADAVYHLISDLPSPGSLTLDDAEQVEAARAAYEALTDAQKQLLEPFANLLPDLEAAEAKIAELKGQDEADIQAAAGVEKKIDALETYLDGHDLPSLDKDDPDDADAIAEAKQQVEEAVTAYDGLTDDQKFLIDAEKTGILTEAVNAINELLATDDKVQIPAVPEPVDISNATVTVAAATYTGDALEPAVTVEVNGEKMRKKDYTTEYTNNINAGNSASVKVTGQGKCTGEKTQAFAIRPKQTVPKVTLTKTKYVWNNQVQTPGVTVKDGARTLTRDQDYTVTYASGRKAVGTYQVTVGLKGNYSGTGKASFQITKAENTLLLTGKTAKVKYKALKKKKKTLDVSKTIAFRNKGQGPLTYSLTGVNKSKFKKYFKVDAKSGKLTIRKGLKKGSYKVSIQVTAAGNGNYKKATKTVTSTVRVK